VGRPGAGGADPRVGIRVDLPRAGMSTRLSTLGLRRAPPGGRTLGTVGVRL